MSEPVGVDFGPVDGEALPHGLRVLLESLQPGQAPLHAAPLPPSPFAQRQDREALRQRLGFAVPGLSVLREAGQVEVLFSLEPEGLVAPQELRGGSAGVLVLYAPDEAVLEAVLHAEVVAGSASQVTSMHVSYGDPWPPAQPATLRLVTSGDTTMVSVHGHHVGVQHHRVGQTRLAWQQRFGSVDCDVTVYAVFSPVSAVQMLARCDVLIGVS
ncbi:hypothetical protein OG218_00465 [Kineococcus sp. NBC_00420]|uniref:hypothetical protein n=1 Tax=Kineococcus sp. NBC_00420 TaxID=2903564 RepID=UPI002E2440F1